MINDDRRQTERRRTSDEAFQQFWLRYPRRVARAAAKKAWDRLRPSDETVGLIMAALDWQVDEWDDPRFTPHPATYLNQERWLDEPVTRKRNARAEPASFHWVCPHVDACLHPAMCQHKTVMGTEKYPVKVAS